jgi:hypothetical protein
MYLVKISLDVEWKENLDKIGMLRVTSERNLDMYEEISACCMDWQNTFDSVNWHFTQS